VQGMLVEDPGQSARFAELFGDVIEGILFEPDGDHGFSKRPALLVLRRLNGENKMS
jgi:hypothetical protein